MKYLTLLGLLVVLRTAAADQVADFRAISLPFSQTTPITVGSSIDIDLINQVRSTCLTFGDADIKWLDGDGALATTATIELVSDYKSLARTLGLEADYKSKADVSISALKAGASVDLHLKYDTFARDESRTLAIVIKAQSDYGRHGLRDYKLKEESNALITAGNLAEFRRRCGTHTVVAELKSSEVAVVITVSDLTSSSKQAIEGLYKYSFNGGGTINIVQVQGSQDFSLKWSSLVEAASRVGTLRTSFESRGGAGIPDATKLLVTSDPANIDKILTTLSGLGSSFTQVNSAPTAYLLISNSALGARIKTADASKLDTLNGYYLQLSRIDYALSRVSNYKTTFPTVYNTFYTKPVLALQQQRNALVSAIEACVLNDLCTYKLPTELGVLYLEDIISVDSINLDCSYQRLSGTDVLGHPVATDVLTNVSVNLKGKVRLSDYVAVKPATLSRLSPDSPNIHVIPTFPALALSQTSKVDGTARIAATLDFLVLHPDVSNVGGSVTINNLSALASARNNIQNSIYSIGIQAKNGLSIQNAVGPAYGGDCPVTR